MAARTPLVEARFSAAIAFGFGSRPASDAWTGGSRGAAVRTRIGSTGRLFAMPSPNTVHSGAGQRLADRTMLAISIAVYAFMLFGGFVVLAFGVVRGVNAARLALGPAAHADGTIFDKTLDEGPSSRVGVTPTSTNDIWYQFLVPPAATEFVGEVAVSSDEWNATEVGGHVDVSYVADDPTTNWTAGHSPVLGEAIAGAFGLAMGVLVLVVTQWRWGPRNVHLPWRRNRA